VRRAIREHLRDFIAIGVLALLAIVTTGVILSRQQANFPSWVPFLGQNHFVLKGKFASAQAVTPGQGQTVTIAGINVGSVGGVSLENGVAVVTMDIDPQYATLIHTDAQLLLRPRTGLQDMTIEIDPGQKNKEISEDATIPTANTEPNVNPDQILASLDGDTQAFLQLLLQGGAQGLGGQAQTFSSGLRRFEPTVRYIAEINSALVKRRKNIRRVVTNLGKLSTALGHRDTQLAQFVRSSDTVFGAFANQAASIRQSLQELPSTLRQTDSTLHSTDRFAQVLGPASRDLIPSAQALAPALREVRPLFRQTTGPIHHQIRPFARKVQPVLRHTRQLAAPLADTTTQVGKTFNNLNLLFNALAYNPPGSEEGYLFWASWLNHNTNSLFFTQDPGGPLRHGLVLLTCNTAINAESVTKPGFGAGDRFIKTLQDLSNVPTSTQISDAGGCN
jgi:phospholipid/cholesterol/gamma-HCH transport system substrate-binding protein